MAQPSVLCIVCQGDRTWEGDVCPLCNGQKIVPLDKIVGWRAALETVVDLYTIRCTLDSEDLRSVAALNDGRTKSEQAGYWSAHHSPCLRCSWRGS